jgi:hypothetical protein
MKKFVCDNVQEIAETNWTLSQICDILLLDF